MGDAGALLPRPAHGGVDHAIGVGRAAVASRDGVGGVAGRSGQTYFFFAPLFIPFFILGVPIVDMAFAFVRRTANRTGFSTPDKNHLHHRLLRLGHGHRRSVLILWAWTACCPASSCSRSISRGERLHPLRRPRPRRGALHPVPPLPPPAGRARGGRGAVRRRPRSTGSRTDPAPHRCRPAGSWPRRRRSPRPRASRPAGPSPPANCKRSVSYVLPPRVGRCDDAGRELQAPRPCAGHQSGQQLDRLSQPNHCVISGTTREAPTPQTP